MADPPPAEKPAAADRVSICSSRYEVLATAELPAYSHAGAKAYAVQATRGGNPLIAYIPLHGEQPRLELIGNATKVNTASVLRYIDSDVAYWPPLGAHAPMLLFEKPLGQRLMTQVNEERPPLTHELHFRMAVESLSEALRDLYLAGVNHGRINPTNIFIRDPASGALQIGEYLGSACSKYQPTAFCTFERGLATPAARGPANASDDIYAIGATLLTLILGKLPCANLSDEDLLRLKAERGSLMALSMGMRIPSAYSEIFRGLLADDPAQRWALDDISHWLGGRRTGSNPSASSGKAQRAFDLDGASANNVRTVAHLLTQKVDAAARAIEDESLQRWVQRSLANEDLSEELTKAITSATTSQRGGNPAERVVTRVAITLDPAAPIRFRGLAVLPHGVGPLLGEIMAAEKSPKDIADLISSQFVIHWVNSQPVPIPDQSMILQNFEGARMLLERPQAGFGVERVLYELNAAMPCLSPLVARFYPLNLKPLLIALEQHAATISETDTRSEPMDRHIAAFILSRYRRMNDRLFPLLSTGTAQAQRSVAILSILAELQRKFHPEPLPKTAEWLARLLKPALERYHHRALREKALKDSLKIAKRGELDQLLAVVDDANLQKQDDEGFRAAQAEWQMLEKQAREMGSNGEARARHLIEQGRLITAFIGALIAMASVVVGVFLQVMP